MIRALLFVLAVFAVPVAADEARLTGGEVGTDAVTLRLDRIVPYRVFTLTDPPRLFIDLRDLAEAAPIDGAGVELIAPDWTRVQVPLPGPLAMDSVRMTSGGGGATLRLGLKPVTPEEFAARSGPPPGLPPSQLPQDPDYGQSALADGVLVVAIDPGHGGIDPGAEHGGVTEAELMLSLGQELAQTIALQPGMQAVLTRETNQFVPLADRISIARAAGADVLLSLHADALEEAQARGGSIYTLSSEAQDRASERMAERHDPADLIAGVDLRGQDDTIATVLMDLARLDTGPRTEALAEALIDGLGQAGAPLNSRPRRQAMLAVLLAADIPSVLVEVGFLSDDRDRARLASPEGRARIIDGLTTGLAAWAEAEADRSDLIRR